MDFGICGKNDTKSPELLYFICKVTQCFSYTQMNVQKKHIKSRINGRMLFIGGQCNNGKIPENKHIFVSMKGATLFALLEIFA